MRPFGRLLTSYTVNELGDAGLVALAVLVYDRTQAVAPIVAFFIAAKFLPALIAPAMTARLTSSPCGAACRGSCHRGCRVRRAGVDGRRRVLPPLVLALGLLDGSLAITGRSLTRGAVAAVLQPARLLREGNALMNIGFALSSWQAPRSQAS